ncbi:MAG TPA: NAD(P)/FAD-dependent oxidoreductase [Mycobacteriales bacterium]|nr:NAD(P)/FAD-dependent oxidoreductase [Mycobacteriales bacterium]HVV76611.1 NAD(P)/FAD-dependent oxidoreductase [Mycobacteriales bacterium]
MKPVVVVGGGIAGAAAALRLAEAGRQVVLFEGGERLGGLVVSFEIGGTPLECFYHHVFPHESHIRGLIDELGLTPKLDWLPSTMGVLSHGRLWPFTTPLDILRFGPMTLPERLRMGVGGLRLQQWRDWESLDTVPAQQWLTRATGPAAVRELWEPLLRAKFGAAAPDVPAAWMWGRFAQRRGARKGSGEKLGYLRGGFRQVFDALASRLTDLGVEIRTHSRVTAVAAEDGKVVAVHADGGDIDTDAVLYTGALPGITKLVPDEYADPKWRSAQGMGVVCSVIETDRPITDVYWTNVCDPSLGFGAIIEQTNLVPASDYGGRHVTYLGRYFTAAEADIATTDAAGLTDTWLDNLAAAYPRFDRSSVQAVHPFKTPYAAPLVTLGYRNRIPDLRSPLRGLYVATTAQIYPADRGMSEGVRLGGEAAAAIVAEQ